VRDFIISLQVKEQQKIAWGLKLLEEGFPLKEPHFKKIADSEKLWELRIVFSGNVFRILFFDWKGNSVVLISGFHKKTQKTPLSEIKLAKKYVKDFLERNNEDA
jgi:phage-related protein